MSTPRGLRELDQIDDDFSALAHATRRQILTVLRVRGRSMTSGDLAARFDCSWPTTTRHLGVLVDSGLLAVKRSGRERIYSTNTPVIDAVAGAGSTASVEPEGRVGNAQHDIDADGSRSAFAQLDSATHPLYIGTSDRSNAAKPE